MAPRLHNKLVKKAATKQKPVPVKIVSDANTVGAYPAAKKNGIDKWEAQDALRTLQRAEEIKRNGALMKAARTEAKNQMKQLSSVCKR